VKDAHDWTKVFSEQEVALPGPLPWSEVFGFETACDLFNGRPQ